MTEDTKDRILKGKKVICDYISAPIYTFQKWLTIGLPAIKIFGSWYAHKDNLDEFIIKFTKENKTQD